MKITNEKSIKLNDIFKNRVNDYGLAISTTCNLDIKILLENML